MTSIWADGVPDNDALEVVAETHATFSEHSLNQEICGISEN
jgi:hypothetical protein